MISPVVLGRPMTTADSRLDQTEVVVAAISSILQKKDMTKINNASDSAIFMGAFHDSLLVSF